MDLRAKLAQLRSMAPPSALFEPPPSAAVEAQGPAFEQTDVRAKLARLRTMEPPDALFEPPPLAAVEAHEPARERANLRGMEPPAVLTGTQPSAAIEAQEPAFERADVRAKLARLRTMEPPAAPPLAASEARKPARERAELRGMEPSAALSELRPADAVEAQEPVRDRADLRAKLARMRGMMPPAALSEPPPPPSPMAATEAQEPAPDRTGLRAKLARLRSMEPPAALFEPAPPPAAAEARETSATNGFASNKGERIAQLRSMIAEISARESRRAPAPPEQTAATPPPWAQESTDHGALHVCARYLEPGHHHGHAPVRSALSALPATLPSLVCDADYADIDLRRALYLDTETTGLAGGTGTVAFLVGLARFEDESLCLEQLVVPQLGTETPMLARLAERIAAASCIVTYNGKSFDWPLLRTRFVLARLPVPALPPHVDLLHVCRRLWKKRLATVRLVDMEREVLRFERHDDLPGSEIPARYFEFLRGGSPELLAPVLEHNQNDIIALPALLGALLQQYEGDRSLCAAGDALYFGKLALRARDCERARSFGEQALSHSTCPREARAALTLCAEIEHKLGSIAAAVELLERAAALETPDGDPVDELAKAQLHFTLAKLYEHAQHDLARALRHARNTELVEGPVLHGRRLGRLYRRLLRSAPRPPRPSP